MAQVSITKAAALAGVSRSTIYRSYINNGKLSVETDAQGKPVIDTSELLRIFPVLHDTPSDMLQNGSSTENEGMIAALEAELSKARALLKAKEDALQKAEEREIWLRDMLTRTQAQITHQAGDSRPWWKFW